MSSELFSKRFKELREELGLTQSELLEKFNSSYHYNFGKSSISMYENGKRIPEINALNDFARYFGVSLDYLIGNTDSKNPYENINVNKIYTYNNNTTSTTFGSRLKDLRQQRNLTQEELGKALNVTNVGVAKWESDNRFPDKDTLVKIADFFDVSLDYLFCRTDDPNCRILTSKELNLDTEDDIEIGIQKDAELNPDSLKYLLDILKKSGMEIKFKDPKKCD